MSQLPTKITYTREQLLAIRNDVLLKKIPINLRIFSNGCEKGIRKRLKSQNIDVPVSPISEETHLTGSGDTETVSNWHRTNRTVSAISSPNSHPPPYKTTSSSFTRHHSGSSETEDVGIKTNNKDVNWALGCGKWRHRSKSGSERGNNKSFISMSSYRGRGRGVEGADFSSYSSSRGRGGDGGELSFSNSRSRGFIRRPYQSHSTRGRGFKPFCDYQVDQEEEFWQEDDWSHNSLMGTPPADFEHSPFSSESVRVPQGSKPVKKSPHDCSQTPVIPINLPPGMKTNEKLEPGKSELNTSSNLPNEPKVTMWYYLDSQEMAQGPFDNTTMSSWFTAGHLPISIRVRRECDQIFSPLTEFITRLGRFPFIDANQLAPFLKEEVCTPLSPSTVSPRQAYSDLEVPLSAVIVPSASPLSNTNKTTNPTSLDTLNHMTDAARKELIRLQEDAKQLLDKATALSVNLLTKDLSKTHLDVSKPTDEPKTIQVPQALSDIEKTSIKIATCSKNSTPIKSSLSTSKKQLPDKKNTVSESKSNLQSNVLTLSPSSDIVNTEIEKSLKKHKKTKKNPQSFSETSEIDNITEIALTCVPKESDSSFQVLSSTDPNSPLKSSTKKTKKKKRKQTAEDLKQLAWQQEEARRKQATIERIAVMDAEAARLLEIERLEHLRELTETQKTTEASRLEANRVKQAHEAAHKKASASLAQFHLPAASKWASSTTQAPAHVEPIRLTEIFAAQVKEEKASSTMRSPGTVTFAQKLAANVPDSSKKSPKNISSNTPPTCSPKGVKIEAKKKQSPGESNQSASSLTSPSIWDLPQTATTSSTTKGNKKKKAKANSQLIIGSVISLQPAARVELTNWCKSQLSNFPKRNVDLPTLISLICDMEEDEDVLECVEASFGKSSQVIKFTKAFVDKRAHLMRLIA